MSDLPRWDERYASGDTPWETGRPSSELERVLAEDAIRPGRALELGCGTGANAAWLARQGFDVTALDISPRAIEQARQRAAGTAVHFLVADVLRPPAELVGPFDFFFDRGCYHVVRRDDPAAYLRTLARLTRPGTLGLVLAGNAREPHEPGPPVVSEEQIRAELGPLFDIVRLREFRFDLSDAVGVRFLGWSCLLRRHDSAGVQTGRIASIVHSPADLEPKPPDHYARVPVEEVTLEAGRGIVGDRKGGTPGRHLNVMARETLEQLGAEGYRAGPGQMGEQIVITGIAIDHLPPGAQLRLGATAVIEVDEARTGCARLRHIQRCTSADVAGRLGVMARVITGGTIRVGDVVEAAQSTEKAGRKTATPG